KPKPKGHYHLCFSPSRRAITSSSPRTTSSTVMTGCTSKYESRKHRTEFVNGHRIVTFHQHMPTPFADSYYEEFDLEIGGCLPLTEYLKDSLLGILVLHGRTLRAFEPADHVLHRHPPK